MGNGESRIRRCLSSELGARFGIVVGWRMKWMSLSVRARNIRPVSNTGSHRLAFLGMTHACHCPPVSPPTEFLSALQDTFSTHYRFRQLEPLLTGGACTDMCCISHLIDAPLGPNFALRWLTRSNPYAMCVCMCIIALF